MQSKSTTLGHIPSTLRWTSLAPYLSVILLECTASKPTTSFEALRREIMRPGRRVSGKVTTVVSTSTLSAENGGSLDQVGALADIGLDQVFGLVQRHDTSPAWATDGSDYVDTEHELTLVVRRGNLIAVRADGNMADKLQRWIDRPPFPQLQRIPSIVLENTFLRGPAKNLWLQGAHSPSTLRPDAKAISGKQLQDALNPFEDSSFAMGSGRCEMPDSTDSRLLRGTIGSTLRNSQVWFKAMPDLRAYLDTLVEIFELIDTVSANVPALTDQFPIFAKPVTDLSEVKGAYEIIPIDAEQLPAASALTEEALDALSLLQVAVLEVNGGSSASRFTVDVGFDGSTSGSLAIKPKAVNQGYTLDAGYSGSPYQEQPVRQILNAINSGDLLSVYYASGHTYTRGQIWKRSTRTRPFPGWKFEKFSPYNIELEKPSINKPSPQNIHDSIGSPGDLSLFAWVAATYSDGWLTCDDGPGETADFIHVAAADGTLRIIHVKSSNSPSKARGVSASAYEIVASQASKNLIYLDQQTLVNRLSTSSVAKPACWTGGKRVDNRDEFLEALASRSEVDPVEVVIVQPHLRAETYQRVHASDANQPNANLLRLHLLETLLNSARASVVQSDSELIVIASQDQ